MSIRKILVGVDGSENSHIALDFALDLSEKFNAAILILNVSKSPTRIAVPQEPTAYSGAGMTAFAKELRKFHKETLSKAVARAKAVKPNLTISSILREGDPALEIVNADKEDGFDVIVFWS
ncbi:MAG: universal stress protein [Candidatus Bathyarchaeia archaeon]|jgi:nucleotide-binding universal stress UspA family protein